MTENQTENIMAYVRELVPMRTTTTIEPPTIKELSSIGAKNNPSRVAFGDGSTAREVTWEEFDAESCRAANAFREYVAQGDRIAFLCESSVEHTILWNGGMKAGCIVSNLHTRAAPKTIRSCIDSLNPRILVVEKQFSEIVEENIYDEISTNLAAVITLDEPQTDYEKPSSSFTSSQDTTEPDIRVDEEDIAVVQWTSGTTGKPKGWCHTNRGLIMRAMKLANLKGTTRETRFPNVFTPSFAAWYTTTLTSMLANASTYFLQNWDPEDYIELIEERSLTTANLVPTMWREILRLEDLDEYNLDSLNNIQSAGEALDKTTLKNLRENICESVYQSYAATEISGTSITEGEMQGERIESVGKPLLGTQVRVIERGGSPTDTVPAGEIGEIILKSSDAAAWVWGDTEKTESAFQNGWWYSGDLGYKDKEGYLFIEGRDDNMILSKGIKVFPTPVEERLNSHPGVVESAVIGIDDEEYGEKVTAAVVRSDSSITPSDLNEWCLGSDELSRYERPREYHFYQEPLPRTASDKLDRNSIKEEVKEV